MGITFIGGSPAPQPNDVPSSMTKAVPGPGGGGFGNLINIQALTVGGTYTATSGTNSVLLYIQAAGGGSAGSPATGAGQVSVGGPGGAGGLVVHRMTSGFNGATVVIGTAGTAGGAGGAGGTGGNSSFAGVTASGGGGGSTGGPGTAVAGFGTGGTAAGGNILNMRGSNSISSFGTNAGALTIASPGANSTFGAGGPINAAATIGFGAGGGGTGNGASQAASVGFAGSGGVVFVYEFA